LVHPAAALLKRRILMKLRTLSALAIALVAATAAFVPTAQAGNVGWSVSVGGPGFAVAAGQPGYYGGHGYYRAPYHPYARSYAYYRPWYRPVVVPRVTYVAPPVVYPYYAPAPIVYAPRPVQYVERPGYYTQQPGWGNEYAPGNGSY
jgi:hypothetical protein